MAVGLSVYIVGVANWCSDMVEIATDGVLFVEASERHKKRCVTSKAETFLPSIAGNFSTFDSVRH